MNPSPNAGGNGLLLLRADDGAKFTTLEIPGGGIVGGLGVDPQRPDRVYLAVNGTDGGAVRVSDDGGATWTRLGEGGLGQIGDLAVGIDGKMLFIATDRGVGRIRLP